MTSIIVGGDFNCKIISCHVQVFAGLLLVTINQKQIFFWSFIDFNSDDVTARRAVVHFSHFANASTAQGFLVSSCVDNKTVTTRGTRRSVVYELGGTC